MRFTKSCRRNADESRVLLKLSYVTAAGIAHSGTQPAYELSDHFGNRTFISDAALDTFRNELRFGLGQFLSVSIARTFFHRADRTHSAICLEASALEKNDFARRFFRSRKKRADHYAIGASGYCL